MVRRGTSKKAKAKTTPLSFTALPSEKKKEKGGTQSEAPDATSARVGLGRPPRSAAVTLTVLEGGQITYTEAMRTARQKISLMDLGIAEIHPKGAITEGLNLEIPGMEEATKADRLAVELSKALKDMGVRVVRLVKHAEMRVSELDDSVIREEVASALAREG